MKKVSMVILATMLAAVGCKKEDEVVPTPQPTPDPEPEQEYVVKPIDETCDNTVYIPEYDQYDGAMLCSDVVVRMNFEGGVTEPDSIILTRDRYGETVLVDKLYGTRTFEGDALALMDMRITASVFFANCVDNIELPVFSGYDFLPAELMHEEHPVICAENGYETRMHSAHGNGDNFKWFKDWDQLPGETEEEIVLGPGDVGEYTLSISYDQCPDEWMNSGTGVLVVEAEAVEPILNRTGNVIEVTNWSNGWVATAALYDQNGNMIVSNDVGRFEDVPSNAVQLIVNFWGAEMYKDLGGMSLQRISVCHRKVNI